MVTFLANNYLIFLIIAVILFFAFIGSLVEIKQDDRFTKTTNLNDELEARRKEVASALSLSFDEINLKNQTGATAASDIRDNSNINEQFEMFAKEQEKLQGDNANKKGKKTKSSKK